MRFLKHALRNALASYPEGFDRIRRLYCSIGFGTRNERDFLYRLASQQKDVFILQVGANDGATDDPIHYFVKKYHWKGVLLEPLPDVFERLQRTYENCPGITLYNAALADHDGTMPFYRVDPVAELPLRYSGLGSFSREVITSHVQKFPEIDGRIVEVSVAISSFASLRQKFHIEKIDILMIDTEGYDHKILKCFDFRRFRPALVIWEQIHLSPSAKQASIDLLTHAGYAVHNSYNMNYVATRR